MWFLVVQFMFLITVPIFLLLPIKILVSMPSTWDVLLLLKYSEQLNVLLPSMDATITRVKSLERIFRRILSSKMLYLPTPLDLMISSSPTLIYLLKLDLR